MMQAVYFCTGFESDCWHYGLAAPIYTHFTSPIRRFADIMVHRALAASIGADKTTPDILDKNYINNVCKNINFRNRMAQQAQVGEFFSDFFEINYFIILACVNCPSHATIFPKTGCQGGNSLYYASETECNLSAYHTVWNGRAYFLQ